MKVDLYTQKGEKNGQVDIKKDFSEVPYNEDLIHQALVRQHANSRSPIAHTKTRGEIRGGGRKPFRQKGTGSARQGSRRTPHFKGGGVVFGPRNTRNFEVEMPKKQRKKALFSALSAKIANKALIALEGFESDTPKTKLFAELVGKLPIERNALFVISEKNQTIQKSSANIPNVKTILVNYLNIADLQKYRTVVFLKDAIAKMEEHFGQGVATAKPKKVEAVEAKEESK